MSWLTLFTLIIPGCAAVAVANSEAVMPKVMVAERYCRHGSLAPGGAPEVEACVQFVARVRHRERVALLASTVCMLLGCCAGAWLQVDLQAGFGFTVIPAFLGRTVAHAVVAGRGAHQVRLDGQRISRGAVPRLADYQPVAWWVAMSVLAVAFLVAYNTCAAYVRPNALAWIRTGTALAIVGLVDGWALARWLARQPHVAETVDELGWADALRSRDIAATLLIGPILSFAVTTTASTGPNNRIEPLLFGLSVGYLILVVALTITVEVVSKHRKLAAHLITSTRTTA